MAYQLASGRVLSRDPADMAHRAGAILAPAGGAADHARLQLPLLGAEHTVVLDPSGARVVDAAGDEAGTWPAVVILHYLAQATGRAPTGRQISYKEIRDGHLYFPNFQGRVIRRLEGVFGGEPDTLVAAGVRLGGCRQEHGDAAVAVSALPRVPLTFIVWGADEEFPARASVLFDETIEEYLPAEDVVVLCQLAAGLLAAGAVRERN